MRWRSTFLFLFMTACSGMFEPDNPFPDATPVPITPDIQATWTDLQRCSGLTRPMGDLRVFTVEPNAPNNMITDGKRAAYAKYIFEYDAIYLSAFYADVPVLLKHEMMHALLGTRDNSHPRKYFNDVCGNLLT